MHKIKLDEELNKTIQKNSDDAWEEMLKMQNEEKKQQNNLQKKGASQVGIE